MIARFSTRHARARDTRWHLLGRLVALVALAWPQRQSRSPPRRRSRPRPRSCSPSKSSRSKASRNIFEPLVRGVVEKAKDMFMQTNFMWAKDLNEVAAIEGKEYAPRVERTRRRDRTHLCQPFHRGGIEAAIGVLPIAARPKDDRRGAEGARRRRWPMPATGATIFPRKSSASMRDEMKKRGHDM